MSAQPAPALWREIEADPPSTRLLLTTAGGYGLDARAGQEAAAA